MSGTRRPFDDVRSALNDISHQDDNQGLRLDPDRIRRTGVPEVVLVERKTPEAVVASLRGLALANGRALGSRCSEEIARIVSSELRERFEVYWHANARAVVVAMPGVQPPESGGAVGVITAGTSDAPVAAEAALMAREMGAMVHEVHDVGVAGLHRLARPLEQVIARGVDVLVVVAGMDGALASVVAGLVGIPVIGLPTSVGYGYGGDGVAALMSMLQSCAPGLVVVNIDNGIGAGATAALIANLAARARLPLSDHAFNPTR